MKKRLTTILAVLVFITGLSLLLYPTVSNYFNSLHQSKVVSHYSDALEKMDEAQKQAAIDAAVQYNTLLVSNDARFTPSEEETRLYNSLLNPDDTGVMGYITIPKIRCKLAIYHSVDDSVLQVGAGHLEGSSLPVGGKGTHCVLSGHRGLPSAKLFTELDRLKKGDTFSLHVYGKICTYRVDQIETVNPEDYQLLQIEEDKDLCTLVTCTPYGINTQRLLVRGHRIANSSGDTDVSSDAAQIRPLLVFACVGLVLVCIVLLIRKRKKKGK